MGTGLCGFEISLYPSRRRPVEKFAARQKEYCQRRAPPSECGEEFKKSRRPAIPILELKLFADYNRVQSWAESEIRDCPVFVMMAPNTSITVLVHKYANGDKQALDHLLPLVYGELRRIAQKHLYDERQGHTLQPTALVHEMYARLVGQDPPDLHDRVHFLSVAAHVMRQILIDHARTKYAQKRGGRQEKLSLDEAQHACMEKPAIMVRIDDALNLLASHDPRKARLIEMRFFGGLTAEESATLLDLPVNVVRRELRVAQAWLQREIGHASDEVPSNTKPSDAE